MAGVPALGPQWPAKKLDYTQKVVQPASPAPNEHKLSGSMPTCFLQCELCIGVVLVHGMADDFFFGNHYEEFRVNTVKVPNNKIWIQPHVMHGCQPRVGGHKKGIHLQKSLDTTTRRAFPTSKNESEFLHFPKMYPR